jgi:hypothetical protein
VKNLIQRLGGTLLYNTKYFKKKHINQIFPFHKIKKLNEKLLGALPCQYPGKHIYENIVMYRHRCLRTVTAAFQTIERAKIYISNKSKS